MTVASTIPITEISSVFIRPTTKTLPWVDPSSTE